MPKAQKRIYSCAACGGPVFKYLSCGKHIDKDREEYAGLGGWRCDKGCKPCKVKVELIK